MKIARFTHAGTTRLGVVDGDAILDVGTADPSLAVDLAAQLAGSATGTPEGVGFVMDPPRCLHPGSVVRIEIDGIGAIENPVVAQGAVATKLAAPATHGKEKR